MRKIFKETTAQWDEVPAKVVGRRMAGVGGWRNADVLHQRINESQHEKAGWPKGVVRFLSHEEADAWWTQNIHFRTK